MRRVLLYLFMIVLLQSVLYAQTFYKTIAQEKQRGEISETQALYLEALRAFRPDLLPTKYRSNDPPLKCAVGLLNRIRLHWSDWNSGQKEILQVFLQRPVLPLSVVSPSGLFRIHYAIGGEHAVSSHDLDGSGIPDYVEETALAMDYSYSVEVETLGFQPPPSDLGTAGFEYDVYLIELNWAYGYTEWEVQLTQDPNTYSSFIVLDNNYIGFPTPLLDGMRVTAAHEFHHMIQMGYHIRDDDGEGWWDDLFIMEATSTWMEDVVYDDINDYVFYLRSFFRETNVPFDYNDGIRMYALCIWFHFLEERLGGRSAGKMLWEEIVQYPAITALSNILQDLGHDFQEELSLFYGWNCMTGSRVDTSQFYPEGHTYPDIALDDIFSFSQDTVITDDVKPLAARYYQFIKADSTIYTFVPTNTDVDTVGLSETFALELVFSGSRPLYTDLDGESQAKLSPGGEDVWKGVAVVESPYHEILFIPFGAHTVNLDTENLPSNFPNPFILSEHDQTTIPFVLQTTGTVNLMIVDAAGYKVRKGGQYFITGLDDSTQFYNWDGTDNSGRVVPSGIYIYVISCDNKTLRKGKIAVIR
jgi:hypothetical protein